jgi:hypothetical protein
VARAVRVLGCLSLGLCLALAGVVRSFRSDKTHVFGAVAGTLADARILDERDTQDSLVRLIEFSNERGEAVGRAWIRRPRELPEDHDTLVLYAGGNTRESILQLIPERQNLVLAAIQYPYKKPESLLGKTLLPMKVREAAFRTVAVGMLAVDYLVDEQCVDPRRLLVVGVSLGSIFATIHAALDERLPELVMIHGGGNFPAIVRAGAARLQEHGWPVAPALWLMWACADTFDPVHWVDRISPRRLTIIATEGDEVFPPESVEAVYERAGEPKELYWTKTEHVHAWRSQVVASLITLVDRRLAGLPIE